MTIIVSSPSSNWDYEYLKSAVASWIHRTTLTSEIIDFITLAEMEINSDFRTRLMETDNTLSLVSGTREVELPTRYIEPISLDLVVSGQENEALTYVQPQQLSVFEGTGASTRPSYWTVNGANIEFPNLADQTYTLSFRMLRGYDIAATSTNTLLDAYPNVYLYASLIQAAMWMRDLQLEQTYRNAYEALRIKISRKEGRSKALTNLRTDLPSNRSTNNILTG